MNGVLGQVNSHLLETADGLVLIDTGYPGNGETIVAAIHSLGHDPQKLRHIVVTHCHEDHAGSLAELKRLTVPKATCIQSTGHWCVKVAACGR